MAFRSYLRDRLPFVALFVGFTLFSLGVVELDRRLAGGTLQWGNALYILLLAFVALGAALIVDYQRQKTFYNQLATLTGDEPLDQLAWLPPSRTYEQRLVTAAWETIYGRLRAELARERLRSRRNVDLISQWAHHMKTPVSVIDLELQRAEHQEWSLATEVITSIAEENQRLNNSLQALLNMVRLEDFAADFRIEQVNLSELIRSLVNEHRREFIARRVYPKVQLEEMGHGAAAVVDTDAKWLCFVLEQLLSNALKYASRPQGDGQVLFQLHRDTAETVLRIRDNGVGIPAEDLPRLCQPFFTGQNGRQYPLATGMGLYLAAEVCKRLDLRLTIESLPGQGTTVSVGFPNRHSTLSGLRGLATQLPHLT